MEEEQNWRKARRNRRRVPKIRKEDIPPFDELPIGEGFWWRNEGRKRQLGREDCIREGRHRFVRADRGYCVSRQKRTGYTVWCQRCGVFAGSTYEEGPCPRDERVS